MHRFYFPDSFASQDIELTGDEAAHLIRVLRICPGEEVTLFDGQGRSAIAVVNDVRKKSAVLAVRQILPDTAPRKPRLTLAVAAPKADRLQWLTEKATELGVDGLVLLQTARSVVTPGEGKLRKLQQTSIAACKQCGRNDLLQIMPPCPWHDLIIQDLPKTLRLVADPRGEPIVRMRESLANAQAVLMVVGPEGGLSDEEQQEARESGFSAVNLGPNILRIETAALCGAAFIRVSGPRVSL